MPGKRPRSTMRRTSSVSLIGSGSMISGDCSPLPEPSKEKHKSHNNGVGPLLTASAPCPPRQVIGFHPKVFIEEDHNHLSISPSSPRPSPGKSPSGSNGSPRSGLGDLLAGSRPWERRDEGVGLGIVAALGAVAQEDGSGGSISKGRAELPPVPAYTRKMSPQHLQSVFTHPRSSPPIPIHSPGANSPPSHHCPSHRYTPNFAPQQQFGLSTAMQESMMTDGAERAGRGGGGGTYMLTAWSQQADMEVESVLPVAPSTPLVTIHHLPTLASGSNFLDACFFCKRRLAEGRDIYMYRGDKAFCSPECRHQQIVMDERPETCSSAATSRHSSQRNRVVAAGTAAAA